MPPPATTTAPRLAPAASFSASSLFPAALSRLSSSASASTAASCGRVASLPEAWDWVPKLDELQRCVRAVGLMLGAEEGDEGLVSNGWMLGSRRETRGCP